METDITLTDEQVERIRQTIDEAGIKKKSLQDDVLDHLCCTVEYKMRRKPVDFNQALAEAVEEVAPQGLLRLEQETVFLLTSKTIINMKKLMYIVGLGSSIALTMGILFKLLHWPGADELITYGFITFALFFLPLLVITSFRRKIQTLMSEKIRTATGLLSGLLVGLAVVFKILHLYGADHMLIAGALIFSFGFLPFLFFTMYKKSVPN